MLVLEQSMKVFRILRLAVNVNLSFFGVKIPNVFIHITICVLYNLAILQYQVFCAQNFPNIKLIAIPFSLLVGLAAGEIIYISYIRNSSSLERLIILLQTMVDHRELMNVHFHIKFVEHSELNN